MRIKVLYFAAVRELAGRDEDEIDLPERATVGDATAVLVQKIPGLAERMRFVRVARNEAFARDADVVSSGDVLALIPPVAGG
jgi:molybdopterin converting factor subunit 1